MYGKRIRAEIDLRAVLENVRTMHALTKEGCGLIPVVKADGYGHGAVPIASVLEKEPYVIRFAAAAPDEAIELRKGGITKPIMLLGPCFDESFDELIRLGIGITVTTVKQAEAVSEAAQSAGKPAEVFIAIDTGMHRIGFKVCEESVREIEEIFKLPYLEPGGIFSHFARADELDRSAARKQLANMQSMIGMLEEKNIHVPLRMISNSAAILTLPEANMDAVRLGIMMYGLLPSDEMEVLLKERNIPLKPAMRLVSHISFIKKIEAGDAVSYGGTYVAEGTRTVATVPAGYADGYPRLLSGKASVLIHGKRAPILGRICMDQFMADVTDIPEAAEGDEVVLIGKDGDDAITAEELGTISGKFNYELVCGISQRVPRVYAEPNA